MEIVSLQYNIALRWKILRLATPKKGGLFFIYIIEICAPGRIGDNRQ